MIKQVWVCKGSHKYVYESPVLLNLLICPQGHESVLVEGEIPEYKPARKKKKVIKKDSNVKEKSYTESLFGDVEIGKVTAKKVTLERK